MLKILRDNLKYLSWILWVVILIFIAFVFVDFGGGLSRGSGGAGCGSDRRDRQDLLRRLRAPVPAARGAVPPGLRRELHAGDRQAAAAPAAGARPAGRSAACSSTRPPNAGLEASDSEVREAIFEIPGMKDAGGGLRRRGDLQALRPRQRLHGAASSRSRCGARSCSPSSMRSSRRASCVSDAEVERAYREQADRAAVRYLVLPSAASRSQATLSSAEARELLRAPLRRVPPAARSASVELPAGRHRRARGPR